MKTACDTHQPPMQDLPLGYDIFLLDPHCRRHLDRLLDSDKSILLPLGTTTVEDMGVSMTAGVNSVPKTSPAIEAFLTMHSLGLSALPVVDESGVLVGCCSASDLRGISPASLPVLAQPLEVFLRIVHGGESRLACGEASAAADEFARGREAKRRHLGTGGAPRSVQAEHTIVAVRPDCPFRQVVQRICAAQVHRVRVKARASAGRVFSPAGMTAPPIIRQAYVVDEVGKPLAVLSLTDILRMLLA